MEESTLALYPEELQKRIVDFVVTYLDTTAGTAARFSDREAIFPESFGHYLGAQITLCRDGILVDFDARISGKIVIVALRPPDNTVNRALSQATLGAFNLQAVAPGVSAAPLFRVMNLTLENSSGDKRPVWDIQVWTRQDVEKWSSEQARDFAVQDAQQWLLLHALGVSIGRKRLPALDQLDELLKRYEDLISDPNTTEYDLQTFLCEQAIILSPTYERVVSKQQIGVGKQFEIDFVLKLEAERYMLVEIEKPSTPIFTKRGDFSAEFTHAERQMIDFLEWINQNIQTARTVLPGISNPRGVVVIGRRSALDTDGIVRLEAKNSATRSRYEFLTFDDLLDRGKFLMTTLRKLES